MIWFLASLPWLYAASIIFRIVIDDRQHRRAMSATIAARDAYYAERDPHCDSCASRLGKEPERPVYRCAMHMSCMAGLIGDPLFGFDFEKYKEQK